MTPYKPLQEQAYEKLKEMILTGELQPDVIYSETKISGEMGISRTPLKNALVYLSRDKYIDIIPSKGFRLHAMNEKDILETYHMRCALEGYGAKLISNDISSYETIKYLSKLEDMIKVQQNIFETTKNAKDFIDNDSDFHKMIVAYAKSEEFDDIFHNHMYRIQKFAIESFSKEGRMQETLVEHTRILNAMKSGNSDLTYSCTQEHIKSLTRITLAKIHNNGL